MFENFADEAKLWKAINDVEELIVGVAGFEPTTSTSQMWRDTGLRYTPSGVIFYYVSM